jgi:ATP-binding cassette subfamily B (MDR/TAP) protein 1
MPDARSDKHPPLALPTRQGIYTSKSRQPSKKANKDRRSVEDIATTTQRTDDNTMNTTPPWRALLFFTNWNHIGFLSLGLLSSVATGAVIPIQAYIVGQLSQQLVNYGTGSETGIGFKSESKRYVIWLVLLGSASWLVNSGFFISWVIFGELQARSARQKLFSSLIEREFEWFDKRKDGVGSLATCIQS